MKKLLILSLLSLSIILFSGCSKKDDTSGDNDKNNNSSASSTESEIKDGLLEPQGEGENIEISMDELLNPGSSDNSSNTDVTGKDNSSASSVGSSSTASSGSSLGGESDTTSGYTSGWR